jgi:hypothetical protein
MRRFAEEVNSFEISLIVNGERRTIPMVFDELQVISEAFLLDSANELAQLIYGDEGYSNLKVVKNI